MNKYNISAVILLLVAIFNAAQAAPSGFNYAAAVVFSLMAGASMVAASRQGGPSQQ